MLVFDAVALVVVLFFQLPLFLLSCPRTLDCTATTVLRVGARLYDDVLDLDDDGDDDEMLPAKTKS